MSAPGLDHFWPQGSNFNKLGRVPPGEAMYQISNAFTLLSDKKIFKVFPYMGICKTSDTWRGAIFDPRAIIWTNLVEVH